MKTIISMSVALLKAFMVIFIIIGSCILAYDGVKDLKSNTLDLNQKAEATITNVYDEEYSEPYMTKIKYIDSNGETHTGWLDCDKKQFLHEDGSTITVYYNKAEPDNYTPHDKGYYLLYFLEIIRIALMLFLAGREIYGIWKRKSLIW